MAVDTSLRETFTEFMADAEPRLRRTLVSLYGPEVGREATADALAYGWEHWAKVKGMDNPAGYLFRVGQTKAKKHRRPEVPFPREPGNPDGEHWTEPGLHTAMTGLSDHQRTTVLLIHGFDWTYEEVSQLMGVSRSTVQRHADRGMAKLRKALEVQSVA
jgi:RNA polymerase sigma-70 factor (ECF subfamily)